MAGKNSPLSVSKHAENIRGWEFSRECLEDLASVSGTLLERVSSVKVGGRVIRLKIRVLRDLRRDLVSILRKEGVKPNKRHSKYLDPLLKVGVLFLLFVYCLFVVDERVRKRSVGWPFGLFHTLVGGRARDRSDMQGEPGPSTDGRRRVTNYHTYIWRSIFSPSRSLSGRKVSAIRAVGSSGRGALFQESVVPVGCVHTVHCWRRNPEKSSRRPDASFVISEGTSKPGF